MFTFLCIDSKAQSWECYDKFINVKVTLLKESDSCYNGVIRIINSSETDIYITASPTIFCDQFSFYPDAISIEVGSFYISNFSSDEHGIVILRKMSPSDSFVVSGKFDCKKKWSKVIISIDYLNSSVNKRIRNKRLLHNFSIKEKLYYTINSIKYGKLCYWMVFCGS